MTKETAGNGKEQPEKKVSNLASLPPQATFFNHMVVRHNNEEFYFDIGQVIPGTGLVALSHRFVTTITHAKRIAEAVNANIKRHEKKFGKISQRKEKAQKHERKSNGN